MKKPYQPNWEHGMILALVATKKEGHITIIDQVDGYDQFEIVVNKWKNISKAITKASCS